MIFKILAFCMNTNRWTKVLFVILLLQFGCIPQRKPGFYCNDPSLSYVYRGDTITWKVLLCTTLCFPLIFILAFEALILSYANKIRDLFTSGRRLWPLYKEYVFGCLLDLAIVQVLKVLVGEPRPHFFDVCKPDTPCEGSEFVPSYKCISTYSDIRKADAGRSFPSGHTSMSVHAAFFLVWYLELRKPLLTRYISKNAVSLVQALLFASAAFCGISRIRDRRHHWWDVLAGGIIGFAILFYTVRYLCRNIPVVWQFDRHVVLTDSTYSELSMEEQSETDFASANMKGTSNQTSRDISS